MGIHVLVDVDELSDVAASEVLAIAERRAYAQRLARETRKSKPVGNVSPAPSDMRGYRSAKER